MSQVKGLIIPLHLPLFSIRGHPLKLEVIFCVQAVISPMLANLYMNRFLKCWRITGKGDAFQGQVVTYADDFVILSRGCARQALDWTRQVMTRIGLTLNEAKTSIRQARQEQFDFLGIRSGRIVTGKMATGIWARVHPRKAFHGSGRRSERC